MCVPEWGGVRSCFLPEQPAGVDSYFSIVLEFAYELIGIFIRDIDFHYFILWTGRSGYPKSEDGRVVIWKAVNICCYFCICLFKFFFAAEGAVA